jgi:predicted phosphate transport protein (TIGR00153 family)
MAKNPLMMLFGQSPFKPLQEHMRVVVRCASETPALFEALFEQDNAKIAQIRDTIFELENEADDIKNELRSHLPKTFFMPVDRRDILEILDLQDSIADTAQDIAGMLMVRQPQVIDAIREPVIALNTRCVEACGQMAAIMEELDELLETGFKGRESDLVMNMIDQLNGLETDTDEMASHLLTQMFAHEDEFDPVSIIIWHRLINWIGDLANYAERVGNRLRLLIAR